MTLLSVLGFQPRKRKHIISPTQINYSDISIIIPVKNNQIGIDRFLSEFLKVHTVAMYPKEVIIVDNNSQPPIILSHEITDSLLNVILLTCLSIGPACARNMGTNYATAKWLLFTDSDCIPTTTSLNGYFTAMNGAVGYAGDVKPWAKDALSMYYETQEILIPTIYHDDEQKYPEYLITANALIWKTALEDIGGFNETILIAAGEDIDLGFRLREIGNLSYASDARVYHNFDDGLLGFIKRFIRYGRGNRIISCLHNFDLSPKPFPAKKPTLFNNILAMLQYICLSWGYAGKDR